MSNASLCGSLSERAWLLQLPEVADASEVTYTYTGHTLTHTPPSLTNLNNRHTTHTHTYARTKYLIRSGHFQFPIKFQFSLRANLKHWTIFKLPTLTKGRCLRGCTIALVEGRSRSRPAGPGLQERRNAGRLLQLLGGGSHSL